MQASQHVSPRHEAKIEGLIPLGLYEYVTIYSTFAMIERFFQELPCCQRADADERLAILKRVRSEPRPFLPQSENS